MTSIPTDAHEYIIVGGHVIDPRNGVNAVRDVHIRAGRIVALLEHANSADYPDAVVVDARGSYVAPGFIDMHVHLREPGMTHKETVATGSAAAVAGGFSAVAAMPNTEPALDTPELLLEIRRLGAQAGLARIYPIAAITKGRAGRELVPYWTLADAGAVAFSDDGTSVEDARVLRQAALYARDVPGPFISHCEDARLKGDAVMNESAQSAKLGLCGAPSVAEDIIVARDLLIAGDVQRPWHIAHISTARSVALMNFARSENIQATCEVTPHHLLLDDAVFTNFHAHTKVNPPLRAQPDARRLRDAVRAGEIDVFATDHAPHTAEEKALLLDDAPVGFTGLEIAVGAYAAAIPDLPVSRFVELLSVNPARILGIPGGSLAPDAVADITIFADQEWTVDTGSFYSKGKNTPLHGRKLPRRARAVFVGGRLAMYDGVVYPAHS